MVSVRKRKHSHAAVTKVTRRTKDKHRKIPVNSNALISKNWDSKLTLIQNYKKLGLTSKLKKAAGGKEKMIQPFYEDDDFLKKQKKLSNIDLNVENLENEIEIEMNNELNDLIVNGMNEDDEINNDKQEEIDEKEIPEGEARIIRDKKTNQIIRVIHGTKKINDDDDKEEKMNEVKIKPSKNSTQFIKELEEFASRPIYRAERAQSIREASWLNSLYEKYNDDYNKMQWDKRLNIYQMTGNQIRLKMVKWKKANQIR